MSDVQSQAEGTSATEVGSARLKTRPTDRLNLALGEFMTAIGRLEFTMLMVIDLVSEASIEHLFDKYAKLTFGKKME